MINRLASFISIVGHPAILMPIAAAIAANAHKGHEQLFLSVLIAIIFAIFVFVYSQVKARIGHREHVDASNKSEYMFSYYHSHALKNYFGY